MTPEQLVPTRDLCQKLVDNGIVLDTHFVWISYDDGNTWTITQKPLRVVKLVFVIIPAPTAEDLMAFLEKLPTTNNITINPIVGNIYAVSLYTPHKNIRIEGHTLSNGLAKLAIKVKKYE